MDPIRIVALVIGVIGLIKGATALASPSKTIGWAREYVLRKDNHHIQFYGFGAAVMSGFLIYMMWGEIRWLPTLTVFIATTIALKGATALIFPEVTRSWVRSIAILPKAALRTIALIMIVLAAYLIAFSAGYW